MKSKKTDAQKLATIKRICGGMQKRNHMSDEKKKNCEIGIAKRWGLKKSKKKS
jgi:hypothetical protein